MTWPGSKAFFDAADAEAAAEFNAAQKVRDEERTLADQYRAKAQRWAALSPEERLGRRKAGELTDTRRAVLLTTEVGVAAGLSGEAARRVVKEKLGMHLAILVKQGADPVQAAVTLVQAVPDYRDAALDGVHGALSRGDAPGPNHRRVFAALERLGLT